MRVNCRSYDPDGSGGCMESTLCSGPCPLLKRGEFRKSPLIEGTKRKDAYNEPGYFDSYDPDDDDRL